MSNYLSEEKKEELSLDQLEKWIKKSVTYCNDEPTPCGDERCLRCDGAYLTKMKLESDSRQIMTQLITRIRAAEAERDKLRQLIERHLLELKHAGAYKTYHTTATLEAALKNGAGAI